MVGGSPLLIPLFFVSSFFGLSECKYLCKISTDGAETVDFSLKLTEKLFNWSAPYCAKLSGLRPVS